MWQKFYKSYQNLTNYLDKFDESCVLGPEVIQIEITI